MKYFVLLTLLFIRTVISQDVSDIRIQVIQQRVENWSTSDPEDIDTIDIDNSTVVIDPSLFEHADKYRIMVRLECNSSHPIQWKYEGPEFPYGGAAHVVKRWDNALNPGRNENGPDIYSAKLTFQVHQVYNTGNYICEILEKSVSRSVYAFFYENETNIAFFAPTHQFATRQPRFDVPRETEWLTIPILSNAKDASSLRFSRMLRGIDVEIKPGEYLSYDSRQGLRLKVTEFQDFRGIWNISTTSGKNIPFTLRSPQYEIMTFEPNVTHTDLQVDTPVIFTCNSKYNFTIFRGRLEEFPEVWPNGGSTYEFDPTSEFPFKGSLTLVPSQQIYRQGIHCRGEEVTDEKPSHSWFLTSPNIPQPIMSYDAENKQFSCCGDSYYYPHIDYISCFSFPDCELLFHYIRRLAYVIGKPVPGTHCDSSRPVYGSIMMSCQVGYEDEVLLLQKRPYSDDHYEVVSKDRPSQDKILILSLLGEDRDVFVGSSLEFTCLGNTFFFADSLHYAMEYRNGTLEYILPSRSQWPTDVDANFYSLISNLVFNSEEIVAVYCFGPIWNSFEYEWLNTSLAVKVLPHYATSTELEDSSTSTTLTNGSPSLLHSNNFLLKIFTPVMLHLLSITYIY